MDPTLAAKIARREAVVRSLQELLVERQQLAQAPADLDPDALLVGGGLDLDSLDVLTLAGDKISGVTAFVVRRADTEDGYARWPEYPPSPELVHSVFERRGLPTRLD